jgi:hypothetical protein
MKKVIYILLILSLISCSKQHTITYLEQRYYSISHYYNDLDVKIYHICDKHNALHLYKDVKGTIIQEIGITNYYKSAKQRMSIVSYTNDIGTCQFQSATYEWLSAKYGINTNIIDPEYSQIEVMVRAFLDNRQNLWVGFKKFNSFKNDIHIYKIPFYL